MKNLNKVLYIILAMIFTFFLLLAEKNASKMTEVKKKKKYVMIKMNSSKIKKIKKKEVPKIDINLKQIKKPTNKISKKNPPKKVAVVKKIPKKKIKKKVIKEIVKKEEKVIKKKLIKKEIIKEPKKLIKKIIKKEMPKKVIKKNREIINNEIKNQEILEKEVIEKEQKKEKEEEIKIVVENIKKNETKIVTENEIILEDLNKKGVEYEIIEKYYPEYPEIAKQIGFEAEVSVVAKALIGVDGRVEKIEIIEGLENFGFNKAVEEVLKYWRFTPIKYNGEIVRAYFMTKFEFRLEEE